MAEKLAFKQVFRKRRTVYGNKGFAASCAVKVNGFCDQLLSGAAFPFDQHRGGGRRHLADRVIHVLHGLAFPDDVSKTVLGLHHCSQAPILFGHLIHGAGLFCVDGKAIVVKRL